MTAFAQTEAQRIATKDRNRNKRIFADPALIWKIVLKVEIRRQFPCLRIGLICIIRADMKLKQSCAISF
jgi:hypothetical protein